MTTALTGDNLRAANDQLAAVADQGAPRMVTADVYDVVCEQRDRLAKKLADVRAELDNVAPSKIELLNAMRSLMDETVNYKKQADEFEQAADELNERNFELIEENSSLRMRLEELGPHL